MSYESFHMGASINSEFEVVPTKVQLLAAGVVVDDKGYINYDGKTYIPNMVKLKDLPRKLQSLFVEKNTEVQVYDEEVKDVVKASKANSGLDKLNNILFEQLQNIVDPEDDVDMSQELKKANTVCAVADKIIHIADLSLRVKKFQDESGLSLE